MADALTADQRVSVEDVEAHGRALLAELLACAGDHPRGGREFALARTKVEEAVMWAVKGIEAGR